jgi:hypothetical protein
MEAVGLKTFIKAHPKSIELIFPTPQAANFCADQLKPRLQFFDDGLETNAHVMAMFVQYIALLKIERKVGNITANYKYSNG